MTHEPLIQLVSDAWRAAADAFTAAELLPLFAVWGLGLRAAEGMARPDDRSADDCRESSHSAARLSA